MLRIKICIKCNYTLRYVALYKIRLLNHRLFLRRPKNAESTALIVSLLIDLPFNSSVRAFLKVFVKACNEYIKIKYITAAVGNKCLGFLIFTFVLNILSQGIILCKLT